MKKIFLSNLQNNLVYFVSEELNGGSVRVVEPSIERIDIEDLDVVLDGTTPVSNLGCND